MILCLVFLSGCSAYEEINYDELHDALDKFELGACEKGCKLTCDYLNKTETDSENNINFCRNLCRGEIEDEKNT